MSFENETAPFFFHFFFESTFNQDEDVKNASVLRLELLGGTWGREIDEED